MKFRLSHGQRSVLLTLLVLAVFFASIAFLQGQQATVRGQGGPRTIDDCVALTSQVPETLVPTPVAGEQYFASAETLVQEVRPVELLPLPEPYTLRWRVGTSVGVGSIDHFTWPTPRPGWYLNWRATPNTAQFDPEVLGMEFVPMVRLRPEGLVPSLPEIRRLAARNRGQVWLIGNEPDVRWQDDAIPEEYACFYHFAHRAIKESDPTARVAIGGLSQITPLRLSYLDRVWQSYREQFGAEMPVDVWNMHAFVLREEAGNWGVGIPPGFDEVPHGVLWAIEQHDNLILVENQIRLMRRWMARHGQRDKPLYITEYGILMPPEYGFDAYRVIQFMTGSFDLFQRLRDEDVGYPADDNRLVQRWVWFIAWDPVYATGNLFDHQGQPSSLMRAMRGYLDANADESSIAR